MSNKKPFAELFKDLFNGFVKKYGTGNRQEIELSDHRGKCLWASIKIVSSQENGSENNKGALCLHLDEHDEKDDFMVLCSSVPKDEKLVGEVLEIRPNLWQSPADRTAGKLKMKLDLTWSPKSAPMARVTTIDSEDDMYASRIIDIACELKKDAKQLLRSKRYIETELSKNGTSAKKESEKVPVG